MKKILIIIIFLLSCEKEADIIIEKNGSVIIKSKRIKCEKEKFLFWETGRLKCYIVEEKGRK